MAWVDVTTRDPGATSWARTMRRAISAEGAKTHRVDTSRDTGEQRRAPLKTGAGRRGLHGRHLGASALPRTMHERARFIDRILSRSQLPDMKPFVVRATAPGAATGPSPDILRPGSDLPGARSVLRRHAAKRRVFSTGSQTGARHEVR